MAQINTNTGTFFWFLGNLVIGSHIDVLDVVLLAYVDLFYNQSIKLHTSYPYTRYCKQATGDYIPVLCAALPVSPL